METTLDILKVLASLSLVVYGVYTVLRPDASAALIDLKAQSPRGRAEVRINLGGFFIGMGIVPVVLNDPDAYLVAGVAYLVAALTRVFSYVMDHPPLDRSYLGIFGFELLMGIILVA